MRAPLRVGLQLNPRHEAINQPHHHLRRPSTDMDLRKALSNPFKKVKHRFEGSGRRRDRGSGGESNREGEGREMDVGRSETTQGGSQPRREVGDSVESGFGRRVGEKGVVQVNPPTSTPSVLPSDNGESNSARSISFHLLYP
jgi:hypothetical protein